MSLIGMAIYSTEENQKDKYLLDTLESLRTTVNFKKHSLILSVNAFTEKTAHIIVKYRDIIREVIYNDRNIGTAEAINKAWKLRKPGEHCIKMDDDVVINQAGWLDLMEEVISIIPKIGQVALKRKDLDESPYGKGQYKSTLVMLPHKKGEKWIIVEQVQHVIGTCVMHSSALLDIVGYLYQPTVYGFDDSCMSYRSTLAGFANVFLPNIEIDHIDPGGTEFTTWKQKHAGETMDEYNKTIQGYKDGKQSIYYNPFT